MEINKGYEIEREFMKRFRGTPHPLGCVDFQNKKYLYEVKSCRLFLKCTNGNHKREFVNKQHKQTTSTQLGRFFVKTENHRSLKFVAEKEEKIPMYVFVIAIGKKKIWMRKSWAEIEILMNKEIDSNPIRIKDLFEGGG